MCIAAARMDHFTTKAGSCIYIMTCLEGYVDCASEDPVPYVIESPIHRMEIVLFCPPSIYVTSKIMIKNTKNESNKRSSCMLNEMRM